MGTRPQHDRAYRHMCQLLRQWREEAGFSQRDLGHLLKKPHTFVHKTETGDRRIDPVEFHRVCVALGRDPVESFEQIGRVIKK